MNPEIDLFAGYRWLYEAAAFLVGLCVGSFLNVVIARVPEGLSIVHPGSRCPKCGTAIRWYDNVPLLGWTLLKGRCRACAAPISLRYPLVELLVGLLALALARRYGLDPRALLYFVFAAFLVVITYIDLDHWIIPHVVSWPGILLGLGTSFVNADLTPAESVVGATSGFAAFALVGIIGAKVFKKEALGQGDWWLLALIGAFLGWKALLPVILLASLQGTVVGLLLILLGRNETGELEEGESTAGELSGPAEPAPTPSAPSPSAPSPGEADAVFPAVPAPAGGAAGDKTGDESAEAEEEEWVPPANAIPFGPFLALAALEQLFFGEWLLSLWEGAFGRIPL